MGVVDFKTHTVLEDTVHAAVCISFAKQTVQVEQEAALVVVLYVEPATHAVHPVLVVTEHKVER